ncbi:MAG: DUF359 domain-containing protein [Desulfurococcaceae archaeon]|nr:DUF359 domain-containing protein [Desulfurococcaceae archaeon]
MSNSSRRQTLPALVLPAKYRLSLARPQGVLHVHRAGGALSGFKSFATVGDVVSRRHHSAIKIIDYKTERYRTLHAEAPCDHVIINPPSSISLNSFTVLTSISKGIVCVIGEEDLLVVPLLRAEGKKVIYGQPGVGLVEVEGNTEMAIKVLKILIPAMVER